MADETRENGLSLSQWADIFGLSPWRVAGFCGHVPDCSAQNKCCSGTWYEYSYQNNNLSRRDVIQAITDAEFNFAQVVGYYPSPHYVEGERLHYPNKSDYRFNNNDGSLKTVLPKWGKILSVGARVCTQLADVTLTFDSLMGMTAATGSTLGSGEVDIDDTFTGTFTVPAGTTVDQLKFYHTEENRLGEPKEDWSIRPVRVEISGTTATITGRIWLLGSPALLMRTDCQCLDAAAEGSYVDEIEVWRCVTDPCAQGEFIYFNSGCANPPCQETTYPLCYQIIDGREGRLAAQPAACDDDDIFRRTVNIRECYSPDRISVNYTSGIPLDPYGKMERNHAKIIALLAASYLDCAICACDCTKERLQKYAQVPKEKISEGALGPRDDRYKLTIPGIGPAAIPDPEFGLLYGQVMARRASMNLRIRLGTTSDAEE